MVKSYLLGISLIAALSISSCGNAQSKADKSESKEASVEQISKDIDVAEFEKLVAQENGLLLDVRTNGEFAESHLKGATQIDFFSSDFEAQVEKLDPNTPVYVYCKSGRRSGKAADIMKGLGFLEVYNLEGGIIAWKNQGKPVEK